MKYCWKCGTQLEDEMKFCASCGEKAVNENTANTDYFAQTALREQIATDSVKLEVKNCETDKKLAACSLCAIAAFIFGLFAVSDLLIVYAVLGVVFGVVALVHINKKGLRGKGFAIVGIILSSIGIVICVMSGLLEVLSFFSSDLIYEELPPFASQFDAYAGYLGYVNFI